MKTKNIFLFAMLIFVLILTSCTEKNPTSVGIDEHNVLTTIKVILKSGTDSTFAIARDTTKVKGKTITEDTLRVTSGKTYLGEVFLYNESVTPIIDLSSEIKELPNEHMFVFSAIDGIESRITINNLNKDGNGKDVGLTFNLIISCSGSAKGYLRVILKHYDSGDKTQAFDTDGDVKLPLIIK